MQNWVCSILLVSSVATASAEPSIRVRNASEEPGEPLLSGMTLVLEGTDSAGNRVRLVTTTADDGSYRFTYDAAFNGEPVSLTMPTSQRVWEFPRFPAPFEGLLPEGVQLDALLRLRKLDSNDLFGQLLAVGNDVVGSLRIEAAHEMPHHE